MAQQNKSNSLTEGSVARGMLLFAIPIFISNLFQQLYNAADSLIVGNFLGGEALAAVGSSGSLIFLLTGFVNGVALGAGVLIARYFGAKDWESLEKAIHTTVALGLAAGAVLTVVGVILTPQILHWMGTRRMLSATRSPTSAPIFWVPLQWSCTMWVPAFCNRSATAAAL